MRKLLFTSIIVAMAVSPALGVRIDPNDEVLLFSGASNTNLDDSRLALYNNTKALTLMEFDIPAGVAPGDTFLHIFGGVDPAGAGWAPGDTQVMSLKAGPWDFDETVETWNSASWLGGAITTPVSTTLTVTSADTTFKWWTFPLAEVINAGLAGQRVTFWLNAGSGIGGSQWTVFEDREGSAFAQHGPGFGGPGFGPWIEIVPEPSTVLFLMLGVVPMLRRRRAA